MRSIWRIEMAGKLPRYTGHDPDGADRTELDHFGNCPVCGAFIDMRDLGQVLAHVHDAENDIGEGKMPPPQARCLAAPTMPAVDGPARKSVRPLSLNPIIVRHSTLP
jgi:hypothetical protein